MGGSSALQDLPRVDSGNHENGWIPTPKQRRSYHRTHLRDFGPVNMMTRSGLVFDLHEFRSDGIGGDGDFGFFPQY